MWARKNIQVALAAEQHPVCTDIKPHFIILMDYMGCKFGKDAAIKGFFLLHSIWLLRWKDTQFEGTLTAGSQNNIEASQCLAVDLTYLLGPLWIWQPKYVSYVYLNMCHVCLWTNLSFLTVWQLGFLSQCPIKQDANPWHFYDLVP